jgi:hypothetical protein
MAPDKNLLQRARARYELARLVKGLSAGALVVPMAAISLTGCGHRHTALTIAAVLAALAVVLVWRGGAGGRGAVSGLVAGIVPLAFPLVACSLCGRAGGVWPIAVCVVGGLASGAIIAACASGEPRDRARFVVSAGLVAALAGSMGCAILGLGGVVAMMVGLVLMTPVALAVAPRPAGG